MDDLQARIAARLNEALDQQIAGGFYSTAERGLAFGGDIVDAAAIMLSIEDVARIAAAEARAQS